MPRCLLPAARPALHAASCRERRYKGEAASPDGVGTAQGLYANDVSGTEEARGAHPFGIEARTVQRAVRAMASEALQTDGEYLETLAGDGSESKLGGVALFVTKFVSKK